MQVIQKITPCLWSDAQAEEAVEFYTGIFRNSIRPVRTSG
jgi:predicted 3-demethylubiquinone-9 3-methyltransferase (glyoxalase superfamily)